jgi:hypothetical protein
VVVAAAAAVARLKVEMRRKRAEWGAELPSSSGSCGGGCGGYNGCKARCSIPEAVLVKGQLPTLLLLLVAAGLPTLNGMPST